MSKLAPQLIVREHVPWKWPAIIAGSVLLIVIGGYGLYSYGHSRADLDFASVQQERDELQQLLAERESQVEELGDRVVLLERASEIDKQAYKEVDDSLRGLQSEILELKEEVAFYRSIVAPRESSRGLRIQRFNIEPGKQPHLFRYKLVLTQVIKNSGMSQGEVQVEFEGLRSGEHVVLALKDVAAEKLEQLSFRFKYFQNFEGDLLIPEGFVPRRVLIKVISNRVTLEKTFDWPASPRANDSLKTSGG